MEDLGRAGSGTALAKALCLERGAVFEGQEEGQCGGEVPRSGVTAGKHRA